MIDLAALPGGAKIGSIPYYSPHGWSYPSSDPGTNYIPVWSSGGALLWMSPAGYAALIDHHLLADLTGNDDHTQYALLAGPTARASFNYGTGSAADHILSGGPSSAAGADGLNWGYGGASFGAGKSFVNAKAATAANGQFVVAVNGTTRLQIDDSGTHTITSILNAITGYRVNGGAASGNVLRGNGTNFVSAALAFSDLTQSAWTGYTPTITQSGTVTSLSANTLRYKQIDKTVFVQGRLTINNAGGAAGANDISVSLPVTAQASDIPYCGVGAVFDASASFIYSAFARLASTTTVKLQANQTSLASGGALFLGSVIFTAALATGDVIDIDMHYEAA